MKHPFKVGQRVICINDRFHPSVSEWGDALPKLNRIYSVKKASRNPCGVTGVYGFAVLLTELNNPNDRLHFNAERFKPFVGLDVDEIKKRVKKALAKPRKASSPAKPAEPAHAIYKQLSLGDYLATKLGRGANPVQAKLPTSDIND